jgi:hypothetical protein
MSSTNKSEANKLTNTLKVDTNAETANALSSANALEVDTLSNMIDLSKQCVKFLDSLQSKRLRLLLDIKKNENDFFEKNPLIASHFNALFDPTIYKSKVQIFLDELEDAVENYCCHEYVEDLIDIEYDQSRRVVYCQLCEVTKR